MSKRPRGFISGYAPRGANVALLQAVRDILDEYHDQLPLTCRQIFYRLVGKLSYEKTEQAYKRLTEMLVLARRGGAIPFDHIRDDGNSVQAPALYESRLDWLQTMQRSAKWMRISPWVAQPRYIEVICEAGGMVPMLARVADRYGVTVRSGGGFDSLTAKHDLAQHYARQGKPVTVLHVGDYDPSGEAIWTALGEDLTAFCDSLDTEFLIKRVAVTPAQRDEFNLPTAPAKKIDKRSVFPEGEQTVQAEALPPDTLQSILRDAIEAELDLEALEETKELEAELRSELTDTVQRIIEELHP